MVHVTVTTDFGLSLIGIVLGLVNLVLHSSRFKRWVNKLGRKDGASTPDGGRGDNP